MCAGEMKFEWIVFIFSFGSEWQIWRKRNFSSTVDLNFTKENTWCDDDEFVQVMYLLYNQLFEEKKCN
jgi:hypothetical protein